MSYPKPLPMERRGYKHQGFKEQYGVVNKISRRLEYGLDLIKAMPRDWTDEKRWAMMVELYDDLLEYSEMAKLWRLANDDKDERFRL